MQFTQIHTTRYLVESRHPAQSVAVLCHHGALTCMIMIPVNFRHILLKQFRTGLKIYGEGEGVPNSRCIYKDCHWALTIFGVIYQVGDNMVPQLVNWSTHRSHDASSNSTEGWRLYWWWSWGGGFILKLLLVNLNKWHLLLRK